MNYSELKSAKREEIIMKEQSNVISMKLYKKKRRTNYLISTAYSAAKFFSIGIIAFLLIWTIYYQNFSLIKGHNEANVDLMEYSD